MDIFWNLFFDLVSQGYKIEFAPLHPTDLPFLDNDCMEVAIKKGQWQRRLVLSKEIMEQCALDSDSLLYLGIKRAASEIEEFMEKEALE